MKKLMIIALAAMGIAFTSCSSEEGATSTNVNAEETGVVVTLGVKADNGILTRSAETSGVYQEGSAKENEVKTCRLYFFDASTKQLVLTRDVESFEYAKTENMVANYKAGKTVKVPAGSYEVYCIANAKNYPSDIAVANGSKVEDLLATVDNSFNGELTAVPAEGMKMTNRGTEAAQLFVREGEKSELNVTVERVLAKVTVDTQKEVFELKDRNNAVIANVTPKSYCLVNLAKSAYNFRHTAAMADNYVDEIPTFADVLPNGWVAPANFGAIPEPTSTQWGYACDPNFFKKTIKDVTSQSSLFTQYAYNTTSQDASKNVIVKGNPIASYIAPNTQYISAQLAGYVTGMLVKCTLVPTVVYDKDGHEVSLSGVTTMYYFNYKFYNSLEAVKTVGQFDYAKQGISESSSDADMEKVNIRRYSKNSGVSSFDVYYTYWIKHLDNGNDNLLGNMEYAIVRNNCYTVNIAGIVGPGSGKPTPIIPTPTPVEGDGELDITIKVAPWIVRSQNATLK